VIRLSREPFKGCSQLTNKWDYKWIKNFLLLLRLC
jgi:hypothetical protein